MNKKSVASAIAYFGLGIVATLWVYQLCKPAGDGWVKDYGINPVIRPFQDNPPSPCGVYANTHEVNYDVQIDYTHIVVLAPGSLLVLCGPSDKDSATWLSVQTLPKAQGN